MPAEAAFLAVVLLGEWLVGPRNHDAAECRRSFGRFHGNRRIDDLVRPRLRRWRRGQPRGGNERKPAWPAIESLAVLRMPSARTVPLPVAPLRSPGVARRPSTAAERLCGACLTRGTRRRVGLAGLGPSEWGTSLRAACHLRDAGRGRAPSWPRQDTATAPSAAIDDDPIRVRAPAFSDPYAGCGAADWLLAAGTRRRTRTVAAAVSHPMVKMQGGAPREFLDRISAQCAGSAG